MWKVFLWHSAIKNWSRDMDWYGPNHNDVMIWKHFPHHCSFVQRVHRPLEDSAHKGPERRNFYFFMYRIRCLVELPMILDALVWHFSNATHHYIDVIMTTMASQITSLTVVYSTVYSDADQRKHQSSTSLAFVQGIHRDRWITRTKGQLRGKCFHLMTSSCLVIQPRHHHRWFNIKMRSYQ